MTPASTSTSTSKKKVAPKNLIRTSAADRTLDSMFPVVPSNRTPPQPPSKTQARTRAPVEDEAGGGDEQPGPSQRREGGRKIKEIRESVIELTSIKDLRKSVVVKQHQGISPTSCSVLCHGPDLVTRGLHEVLEGHVFVGIVDLDRCLSLIQHSTQLYLLNHGSLA